MLSIDEPDSQNAFTHFSHTKEPLFRFCAVRYVFQNNTVWISRSILSDKESDAMLFLIADIFFRIPFKLCSLWRSHAQVTPQ